MRGVKGGEERNKKKLCTTMWGGDFFRAQAFSLATTFNWSLIPFLPFLTTPTTTLSIPWPVGHRHRWKREREWRKKCDVSFYYRCGGRLACESVQMTPPPPPAPPSFSHILKCCSLLLIMNHGEEREKRGNMMDQVKVPSLSFSF